MSFGNNQLVNSDANLFFENECFAMDNVTLETILRYIAIKHRAANIEEVTPIGFSDYSISGGHSGNDYASLSGEELIIVHSANGYKIPCIDLEGWVELNTPPFPVSQFLSKCSETRVFVNSDLKRSVVFVKTATNRWLDSLSMSMFRVLPWYFENGITDEEKALFGAVHDGKEEVFNEIVNRLAVECNFKEIVTRKSLLGWSDGYRDCEIGRHKSIITDSYSRIRDYEEKIASLLDRASKSSVQIQALSAQKTDREEFLNFFLRHPQLSIYNVDKSDSGNALDYCVTETIEYYDEEEFLRVYENQDSSFGIASKEIRDILYALFHDGKGAIRAQAVFRLNNLSSIKACNHTINREYAKTHIPHPHLVEYGCLGTNEMYIRQAFEAGNWDVAIEQSISAVKNINFGDAVVMGRFVNILNNIFKEDRKCVVSKEGVEMTLQEFLQYIQEKKGEETTNG